MLATHRLVLCLLALAATTLTSCTGFHTIVDGAFYRDRQPTEDELVEHISREGIRTVVMLRSLNEDTRATRRAAWVSGADFVNVPISAKRLPTPAQLRAIWQVIETAARPVLFHCRAGVDRTGLCAALSVLHETGSLALARRQLAAIPFGHVGMFGTESMGRVLDLFEASHAGLSFGAWVDSVYATAFVALQEP
jgi:uncharacterized protein (TIGR01244 family)